MLPEDGGDSDEVLAAFAKAGIDHAALAETLQREGAESFSKSWTHLMDYLVQKAATVTKAG
jgi:transaldolase